MTEYDSIDAQASIKVKIIEIWSKKLNRDKEHLSGGFKQFDCPGTVGQSKLMSMISFFSSFIPIEGESTCSSFQKLIENFNRLKTFLVYASNGMKLSNGGNRYSKIMSLNKKHHCYVEMWPWQVDGWTFKVLFVLFSIIRIRFVSSTFTELSPESFIGSIDLFILKPRNGYEWET